MQALLSTDADGRIGNMRHSCSGTGNPWGQGCWHTLAATHAQEPSSGWVHQACCLYVVKPARRHAADVPHLIACISA